MIERVDFAPLDGITKAVFRRVFHARFGGADRYFIPFSRPQTSTSSRSGTSGNWTLPIIRGSPWCPRS